MRKLTSASALATAVACSQAPTEPDSITGAVVTQVQISGPASVAPGETAQYRAIATRSDGSQQDITSGASWGIAGDAWWVFSHAGGGLVTGKQVGEGQLRAVVTVPERASSVRGVRDVIVTPAGSVRVKGVITAAGGPVTAASVVLTSGVSAGLSASTDWEGRYAIFGIAGAGVLSITKNGYPPVQLSVSGTEHQTLNAALVPVAALPDVAGSYTLTIDASPSCRVGLTEAARRRTYTATLVQDTTRIFVSLTGGQLLANSFDGRVDPGDVQFTLAGYWDYYWTGGSFPGVVDDVAPNPFRQLTIAGRASTQPNPGGLAGLLDGEFLTFDRTMVCCPYLPWMAPTPVESCSAPDHAFSLTRIGGTNSR